MIELRQKISFRKLKRFTVCMDPIRDLRGRVWDYLQYQCEHLRNLPMSSDFRETWTKDGQKDM